MRGFAFTNGLRRLFSFGAVMALSFAMLCMSGCCGYHRCHCNKCNKCNTCNTCNTCGTVSDNSSSGGCSACAACTTGTCSTCNTCNSGSQYDRVGTAPATLSEPQPAQAPAAAYTTAPAYSTANNYAGTNASLERPGESRDLPVFSPAIPQQTVAQPAPVYPQPQAQPAGAMVQESAVRGGGQYHTLQQGETVYALSRRYGVKARTILEANHFSDPNHLSVGTKVYIPAN